MCKDFKFGFRFALRLCKGGFMSRANWKIAERMSLMLIASILVAPSFLLAASAAASAPKTVEEQIRHELVMLPYYSVFDELSFQVNGTSVTLMGKVIRPVLRSDAENVVKRVAGVSAVKNEIEVLP